MLYAMKTFYLFVMFLAMAFSSHPSFAKVHSFTNVDFLLDGQRSQFQIRVICPDAFEVTSLFVTVRDPDNGSRVRFTSVLGLASIFGSDFDPPYSWSINHTDFGPIAAGSRSSGFEILSHMRVEKPVGIATGGSFDILGSRISGSGNETISVAAIVNTSPESTRKCRIVIVDF